MRVQVNNDFDQYSSASKLFQPGTQMKSAVMFGVNSLMYKLATLSVLVIVIWLTGCEEGIGRKYLTYFPSSAFIGASSAWLITSDGDMFRSVNAGNTWIKVSREIIGEFRQVSFITQDIGWAVNSSGQIWNSNNGGQNWERIGSLEPSYVELRQASFLAFVDNRHGWAASDSFIWRSIDGGRNWQRHSPAKNTNRVGIDLGRASFQNNQEGWIGADSGIIYHTRDGGISWEQQTIASNRTFFRDVIFVDNMTGWATGFPNEGIYRTENGGNTWHSISWPGIINKSLIRSIHFIDKTEGWAVGQAWSDTEAPGTSKDRWGVAFQTSDSGRHWRQIQMAGKEPFYDKVYFYDTKHGWVIGWRKAYYTNDGGITWQMVLEYK